MTSSAAPETISDEDMTGRLDAALVTFALEQGKGPRFIKMSHTTLVVWRKLGTGEKESWWTYRGLPIKFANLAFGEVECV